MTPGIERQSNEAAQIGVEMHSHLEVWLKESVTPTGNSVATAMAEALIPYWPPPSEVHAVEEHCEVQTEHAHYHGYIDLEYVEEDDYVVGDHKSTSDLKWAKTKETLLKDPQTVIYSAARMAKYELDRVRTRWGYVTRSKKPKIKIVEQYMTRQQVEEAFNDLDKTAKEIYALEADPPKSALDIPPCVEACDALGGCPFKDLCTDLTPAKRMVALMKQMTLREKILAKNAEKAKQEGTKEAPAPEAKAEAPAKAEKTEKPVSLREKMLAKKAADGHVAKEPEPEPEAKVEEKPEPKAKAAPKPKKEAKTPTSNPEASPEAEDVASRIDKDKPAGNIFGGNFGPGLYFVVKFEDGRQGLFGPISSEIKSDVFKILCAKPGVEGIFEQVHK